MKSLKKRREPDATVVCIDQTRASVQVEPRKAWFPKGSRPAVELSGQRDWTCVLGAITEDGDAFFSQTEEYITAQHAKHFILALQGEFQEELIVVLDGAPYFQASTVTELADQEPISFVRLPAYTPELNPVEECWQQLKTSLGNRLFTSLRDLKRAINASLTQLSLPNMSNYF